MGVNPVQRVSRRGPTDLYDVTLVGGHVLVIATIIGAVLLTRDIDVALPIALLGAALITWRALNGWTQGWCGDRIRQDHAPAILFLILVFCGQFVALAALFAWGHIVAAQPSLDFGTPHFDALMSCVLLSVGVTFGEFGGLYSLLTAFAARYGIQRETNGRSIWLALAIALSAQVGTWLVLASLGIIRLHTALDIALPRDTPSIVLFLAFFGLVLLFSITTIGALAALSRPISRLFRSGSQE